MFNVGDQVRYNRKGMFGWESENWCDTANLKIGGIYNVLEIFYDDEDNKKFSIKLVEDNSYHIHPDHFVLVEKNKFCTFEVGDVVKCVTTEKIDWEVEDEENWCESDGLEVGGLYKIEYVHPNGIDVEVGASRRNYVHHHQHFVKHIETCKECTCEFTNSDGYCRDHC